MKLFLAVLVLAALACGGSNPVAVKPPPPPVALHDPEIFFHFYYPDSAGVLLHTEPYPDTAMIRWYDGTGVNPGTLRAQLKITGTDSLCADFFAPDSIDQSFSLYWIRHDTTTGALTTVGPFNPIVEPNLHWDIAMSEDTVNGSSSVQLDKTHGCPDGFPRDSIKP